jgi:hypothetical protein
MPRETKLYTVLIASPSELHGERHVLKEVIYAWNTVHWQRDGIALLPLMWETDAHPAAGKPQTVINRQIVDEADILIALFWYRIGTATESHPSGTVEEIERFIKSDKSVLVYFSEANIPINHDPEQLRAVNQYRESLKDRVAYRTFKDPDHLHKMVSSHLALEMNELVTRTSGLSVVQPEEIGALLEPIIELTGECPHQMLQLSAAGSGSVWIQAIEYFTAQGISQGREEFGRFMPGSQVSMALNQNRLLQIYNLKPRASSETVPLKLKVEYLGTSDRARDIYISALMMPSVNLDHGSGLLRMYMNVVLTEDVNWKTGNLYWLGSDLMWTWMYAKAGNLPRTNHGLNKAVHHATALGLRDPILSRLKALEIANAGRQSISAAEKTSLIHELDEIISQIGKMAEHNQSDFKADPEKGI